MKIALTLTCPNKYFIIFLTFLFVQKLYAQPTISSFSPTSGGVGTTVTINGTNFNPFAAGNTVYFGAVKANISGASTTALTVSVPYGATYQPLTVTTNHLTAYSLQRFAVTFSTLNSKLSTSSFTRSQDIPVGSNPRQVSVADFDGDGKPDMAVTNQASNTISIARNTSTKTKISFANNINYGTSQQPFDIGTGDFDGDGKLDLAVSIFNGGLAGSVSIFRNTSSTGNISFASPINYATGNAALSVAIGDLNGDGKPDLVVVNPNSYTFSVLKNTTTSPGVISFAPKIDYISSDRPDAVRMADFNGDGRTDLATANSGTNSVSVYQNISSSDLIAFAPKANFAAGNYPGKIITGDIDRDGRDDIVVTNYTSNSISVLRNASITGSIAFDLPSVHETETNPISLCLGDFNGDGKPEIAVANQTSNFLTVLENQGGPGAIDFSKTNYVLTSSNTGIEAVDFDGDGKPDIAETNLIFGVSIMRNRINEPMIASFSPTVAGAGDTVMIKGQNFTGATEVKFGSTKAFSLGVLSDSVMTAVVADGVSGAITVTTPNGTVSLNGFTFAGPPVILSFTPTTALEGTVVTLNGNNLKGALSVKFAGVDASAFTATSDTMIAATVGAGATGSITVSTIYGTASRPGFTYIPTPKITSFSPAFGPVGTHVTITGINFDPDPAKNVVRFGAQRAAVTAAGSDSLVVIVPIGATFKPITVTRNNLVSTSRQPFYVTFPGSNSFTTTSFEPKVDFTTGSYPRGITAQDFDDDGKTDLAVVNNNSASISIFKNTSTIETILFASKVDYQTGNNPMQIASGDLNGDGKADIVVGNYGANTVSIFTNTSAGGTITFAPKIDFATADNPASVSIADINADGKPDITALNNNSNSVSVLRNTTTINGTMSFAPKIDFATGSWPQAAATGDIDGDGKPDIVSANYNSNTISVLRNTSAGQFISFAAKADYSTGTNPFNVIIGDLDSNSAPEIIVSNSNSSMLSVFKNTSSVGVISLTKSDFATGNIPLGIGIENLDGNIKPDLAIVDFGAQTVSLFNNKTEGNSILFQPRVALPTAASPRDIAIGDYNSDGKPDLAVTNSNSNAVSIFRNRIGDLYYAELCPGGNTQITSRVTGTDFQWQVNTGSGFLNINDDINYTGTHSILLQLNNIPSSWYGYEYRCLVDTSTSEITSLRFVNSWNGSAGSEWGNPDNWNCGQVPDANTDVIITNGSVVLSSNGICGSLKVNSGTSFIVSEGYTLTITRTNPKVNKE